MRGAQGLADTADITFITSFLRDTILSAKPQKTNLNVRRNEIMANSNNGSNKGMVPEARAAMDRFKMEAANDAAATKL